MCKPNPAPMCATHARRALAAAETRLAAARDALAEAEQMLADPDGALTNAQRAWWDTEAHTRRADVAAAVRDHATHAATMDATPTGLGLLEKALEAIDRTPAAYDPATRARLASRLAVARVRHEREEKAWRTSAAFVLHRLTRRTSGTPEWDADVAEYARRKATETATPLPPAGESRTAWETSTPEGRAWAAVRDLYGPRTADCAYAHPTIQLIANRPVLDTLRLAEQVVRALPAALIPDGPTYRFAKARRENRHWRPSATDLVTAASDHGTTLVDQAGEWAPEGQPGDAWAFLPITGPLDLTAAGFPGVHATRSGFVAVRLRDRLIRLRPDLPQDPA